MDAPAPPQDQELRNIIDKLAQFVARNGPEFEQMTKLKQKDNPKFSFLFGGEHFNYYQYQVTTLQAAMKQKEAQVAMGAQPASTPPMQTGMPQGLMVTPTGLAAPQATAWQTGIPPVAAIAQVQQQIQELQDQIRQSEQNLAAQHQVLLQQQQVQLDEAIRKAQDDKLASQASECDIDIAELDKVLQPIIESCTKDAISSGKGWIFSHSTTAERNELICQYLLKKVTVPGAAFDMKLHIVYLINDVLHHCVRKNADELKLALDKVVVPIFCTTSIGVDDDKGQKLAKLLKLWETNKYFEPLILEQLKNPAISIANYQASLITEHASVITAVTVGVQAKYVQLQKQHQDFVTHLTSRIQALQLGLMQLPPAMLQTGLQQLPPVAQQPATPQVSTPQATVPPQANPSQQTPMVSRPAAAATPAPPVASVQQAQDSVMMESVGNGDSEAQQHRQPGGDDTLPIRDGHMPPDERAPHNMHGGMHDMPPHDMMGDMGHPNHGGYGGRGPIMDTGPYHGGPPMGRHPGMGGPPYMGNGPQGYSQSQMYGPHPPGGFGRHGPPPPDYLPPHGGPPGYGCGGPPRHPMHDFDYDLRDDYYDDYDMDFYSGPAPGPSTGMGLPDITKPPPGFMQGDMSECLIPTVPYFDLPAGLIVPLVKLSDCDYKPLDPKDIRLPPPAPPSDALLNAVEMFYAPPSHERPRNSEGWEQLGLYEFFKAKSQHTKKKSYHDSEGNSEDESPGRDEDNRRSPVRDEPLPQRRRYRESKSPPPIIKEEEEDPERERRKSKKKSRSRSPSRSESRSPPPPHRHRHRRSSSSRSRSRSPGSPVVRKRSPERSPTPPSFFGSSYGGEPMTSRLDESNKGHQLLRKMGWGGAGLGAAEQGIQDPIHAGDVRDRQDMYKGIGISLNDPYESFRKSKGQAFINRMKARQEELGGVAGK